LEEVTLVFNGSGMDRRKRGGMKRASSALSILLFLMFILPLRLEISLKPSLDVAYAAGNQDNVIYVPANFSTIQGAIDNASAGTVIYVLNGTYNEDVVINKSVSLIGIDRDLTIIRGFRSSHVLSITANNVLVRNFTIMKSGISLGESGIRLASSGNVINHNNITNENTDMGIFCYSSNNNVISDNVISGNKNGFYLGLSGNNVLSGNIISNNDVGAGLYYSSNNVFSANSLSNNRVGVSLNLYSNNNVFFHNNFDNTIQVSSVQVSGNAWSNGGEGNYWSDYNGTDVLGGLYQNETGADGIGDQPYTAEASNQDSYPLMGMFSGFMVSLRDKTYDITVVCNSTISDFRFDIGEETGNRIIHFNVVGENNSVGFCRIMIPTELLSYPYVVLISGEEIIPSLLSVSNPTAAYLYFTYFDGSRTISVISSKTLHLYYELSDQLLALQSNLSGLNVTYYGLLGNYTFLLGNFSQLQDKYLALNSSYQEHLLDYSRSVENFKNLTYAFASTTVVFLLATIYLSKRRMVRKHTQD
jgi:parallel beta-helix repeat protein